MTTEVNILNANELFDQLENEVRKSLGVDHYPTKREKAVSVPLLDEIAHPRKESAKREVREVLEQKSKEAMYLRTGEHSFKSMLHLNRKIHFANRRCFILFRLERDKNQVTKEVQEEQTITDGEKLREEDEKRCWFEVLVRMARAYSLLLKKRNKIDVFILRKFYYRKKKETEDEFLIQKRQKSQQIIMKDIKVVVRALYVQARIKSEVIKNKRMWAAGKIVMPSGFGHTYIDEFGQLQKIQLSPKLAEAPLESFQYSFWQPMEGSCTLSERTREWETECPERSETWKPQKRKEFKGCGKHRKHVLRYSKMIKGLIDQLNNEANQQEDYKENIDILEEEPDSTKETLTENEKNISECEKIKLKVDNLRMGDVFWCSRNLNLPYQGHILYDRHGKGHRAEEVLSGKTCLVVVFAGLRHAFTKEMSILDSFFKKSKCLQEKAGLVTVCLEGGTLQMSLMMSVRRSRALYTSNRRYLACSLFLQCRPASLPAFVALDSSSHLSSPDALSDLLALGTSASLLKWSARPPLAPFSSLLGFDEPGTSDLGEHFSWSHICPERKQSWMPQEWKYVHEEHTVFQPELYVGSQHQ